MENNIKKSSRSKYESPVIEAVKVELEEGIAAAKASIYPVGSNTQWQPQEQSWGESNRNTSILQ